MYRADYLPLLKDSHENHITIVLFLATVAITKNIFCVSIFAVTWIANATPMYLMWRQEWIERKSFQFWAALSS